LTAFRNTVGGQEECWGSICCRANKGLKLAPKIASRTSQAIVELRLTNRERAIWNSHTSPSEKIALVRRLPLFSDVDPAICATIISAACEKRLWRRQTIFSEGDPMQQVMMLLSGSVKITQLGLGGDEVILRLSGIGDMVGDFQPSANCKHSSTAQIVQAAVALVWEVGNFEKLLDRFPAFRRNTVRALEERLREMEQRFREVSTLDVGQRLSSELIRLSNRFGCSVNGFREIHFSRGELAQLTGTTLSTLSRLLCRWQELGIVGIRREVVRFATWPHLRSSPSAND
jgi:CRP/FNR family transcriptional regulator, nitrogen oxide reductase regulator